MNPLNLIPSKAWLYGALAAFGAAIVAWLRFDAVRDDRREQKQKDTERALDIHKSADQALRAADGADSIEFLRKHNAIRRDKK